MSEGSTVTAVQMPTMSYLFGFVGFEPGQPAHINRAGKAARKREDIAVLTS